MIKSISLRVAYLITIACLFIQTGCSLMVNPNYDELSTDGVTITPSERGVREAQVSVADQLVRPFETIQCPAHTGSNTHGPLYFVDPYEMHGSDNDQFAWTLEEPFYFMLGPMRYGANMFFWPISVVVSPPWVPVTVADAGTTQLDIPQEEVSHEVSDDEEVSPK